MLWKARQKPGKAEQFYSRTTPKIAPQEAHRLQLRVSPGGHGGGQELHQGTRLPAAPSWHGPLYGTMEPRPE